MRLTDLKLQKISLRHTEKPITDIAGLVIRELDSLQGDVKPGMRIGIAVGSRGISNLSLIVKTAVDVLFHYGAKPFIIPAMGSHGGATADGQCAILREYGITEELMGCPIKSNMNVKMIGSTGGEPDIPVYMDQYAWESDGVLAINRVKSHTDFHGSHESGIVKILTIGLGKHAQAVTIHQYGADGLRDYIPRVSKVVINSGKIFGALGILEDGYDNTSDIIFAKGDDIFEVDKQLLARSRSMMARLPFDRIHVLVVDQMGKNYSGTGLDTNVIGRMCIRGQKDAAPHCSRIVTLDLTDESHGNALGIGLSDIVTQKLVNKIDWDATWTNVITSGFLERGFLPIIRQTEREAIDLAISTCGVQNPDTVRFVRIKNTLDLKEIWLSPALLRDLSKDLYTPDIMPERTIAFKDGCIEPF